MINLQDSTIEKLTISHGQLYAPCAGLDIGIALKLFGNKVQSFTFCDIAYKTRSISAKKYIPKELHRWTLKTRTESYDNLKPMKISLNGNKPFRVSSVTEIWLRPDNSEVEINFVRDLAEDVLIEHFQSSSISVFMHINDGESEGGSDLWFLASKQKEYSNSKNTKMYLKEVSERLADNAIIITDCILADNKFRTNLPFKLLNKFWHPIGKLQNNRVSDRVPKLWYALTN